MPNWDERAERWSRMGAQRTEVYGPATETMLDMASLGTDSRVLDVACGTGDQTIMIARRVSPDGTVLATDNSNGMLKAAAEAIKGAGLTNVETRLMDAENLTLDGDSFDAVICRLGLMIFANPSKVLGEMRRVLKPGGKVAVLVRAVADKNPYEAIPLEVVHRLGGSTPPPFPLSEPHLLENNFTKAGFSRCTVHEVPLMRRFSSITEVSGRLKNGGYMLERPLAKLSDVQREQARMEIERQLRPFEGPNGCELPGEVLIGIGTKD